MINPDTGKLVITAGGTTLVNISDNQPGSSPNLTATLEDNGNFQLKNEPDNRILWQSFDHPTNILLSGMKLGSDLKTGRNWNLTSWSTNEIPDSGAFTLSWEPNGENSQRMMIRRRGQPYWTSGDLRNQTFEFMSGINNPFSKYLYNLSYEYNNEERYLSYHDVNGVRPMWILNPKGEIIDGDSSFIWSPEFCYGYDSGNGCVEDSDLPKCRNADDEFSLRNGDFSPQMTSSSYDSNSSLIMSDCMVKCWNDCDCLGFTTSSNETGCITWTGTKLVNNFSINVQGTSISKYVLISPTTTTTKGKAKNWIWGPIVAGIFLLLLCFGLFWYRKKQDADRQKRDDEYFLELMASESFKGESNLESNGRKGSDLILFSFASLVAATNDFSSDNKLGEGETW